MYYAIDENGIKFSASNARKGVSYFCHACKSRVTLKQGSRVAHHFAHKPNDMCDPLYHQRTKSEWHSEMQCYFPEEKRERVVWNEDKTEFRIADVLLETATDKVVFEFQFSPISANEFYERTLFYLKRGIKVIWIINYATIQNPKKILYTNLTNTDLSKLHFVWPGRDYVNIFDDYSVERLFNRFGCNIENYLTVFLFVFSFHGLKKEKEYNGRPYIKWETNYFPPAHHLLIKPDFFNSIDMKEFDAKCFRESEFVEQLSLNKDDLGKLCLACWK